MVALVRIPLILSGFLAALQPAPILAQRGAPPGLPPAVVPAPPPPFHLRDADLDRRLSDRRDRFRDALRDEFYSYSAALGAIRKARQAGGSQAWAAAGQAVAAQSSRARAIAAVELEFRAFLVRVGGSLSAREAQYLRDTDCLMKDNVILELTRSGDLTALLGGSGAEPSE